MADVSLWAKRLSGASFLLVLLGVVSYYNAMPVMFDELDPAQSHMLELEPGESGEVSLSNLGEYVALRVAGDDGQGAGLRLIDSLGAEESGSAPTAIDVERPGEDGTIYAPVRVFRTAPGGEYTLHNDASTTLWLVDDVAAQNALFKSGWFVMMFLGCCLGLPLGIVAVVLALVGRGQGKEVADGVVLTEEGRLPTTDELYRQHRGLPEAETTQTVADPFPEQGEAAKEPPAQEEKDWRGWDEG